MAAEVSKYLYNNDLEKKSYRIGLTFTASMAGRIVEIESGGLGNVARVDNFRCS
jgi:hypothetical protein